MTTPNGVAVDYVPPVPTDIVNFVSVLLRNAWVIVLMAALAALGAYFLVRSQTPQYESRTSLIISPRVDIDISDTLAGIDVLNQNIVGTYVQILRSAKVQQAAKETLRSQYGEALDNAEIDVRPIENSTVMVVTVRSESPELARDLSDAIADQVVQNNPVDALIQAYPLLVLDQAVVPETPQAPQGNMNIVMGAAGGAVVGIGLAFLLEEYRKARTLRLAS